MNLLPCPFCGEHLVEKTDTYVSWFAHRDEGTACLTRLVALYDEEDRRAWNMRAPLLAGDLRGAFGDDAEHRFITQMFENAGRIEELPPGAQDFVARHIEEARQTSWQAGFTEGLGKAAAGAPQIKSLVAPSAGGEARINGYGVGDQVEVVGSDQKFDGTVVAAFPKLWGAARFVVEDQKGVLHIYGAKNLRILTAALDATEPPSPSADEPDQSQLQMLLDDG